MSEPHTNRFRVAEPEAPPSVLAWRPSTRLLQLAVRGGLVIVVAILAWRWFFSDTLSVIRVGPKPSAGHRLVVLLHGHGAAGDDLEPLAKSLSDAAPDITFLLPEGPYSASGGRTWVSAVEAPSKAELDAKVEADVTKVTGQLWAVVEGARKAGVACGDIVLAGFSLGGRLALETAMRAPPGCALGGLVTLSAVGKWQHAFPPPGSAAFPALVVQGTEDTVVKPNNAQEIREYLEKAGHAVTMVTFKGPHTVSAEGEAALLAFLRR